VHADQVDAELLRFLEDGDRHLRGPWGLTVA
jgi:hypothetical protein